MRSHIQHHVRPFIEDVGDRQPDLIQEIEIRVRSIPCIKRLFSVTAVHHGATKSASDRRHGSSRRTVRIRLDIGRRLRRCRDRRLSEGPGLCATIIDLPNIAPVAKTFIAEAGLSDRVSTLAADGVAACLPAMFVVRCRYIAHSMDSDAFSSLKAFSTFRAHRHRCMLVLRRRGTVGTLRLRANGHCIGRMASGYQPLAVSMLHWSTRRALMVTGISPSACARPPDSLRSVRRSHPRPRSVSAPVPPRPRPHPAFLGIDRRSAP